MERYLLQEHWSSLVRIFKDEERAFDQETYDSEQLAFFLLDFIQTTRFRQYNLFTQKRGEEFERMLIRAEERGFSVDSVRRFIEDDDRWTTTLEIAEQ